MDGGALAESPDPASTPPGGVSPAVGTGLGEGVATKIGTIVFSHGIVDFFSAILIPLLSVLEGRVALSPGQGALLLAVGSLSSGLIQPVIALWGDKHDTRWLGTLGMLVAAICMPLVGFATEYWHLMLIQLVGAAGVGAFHPPAAAITGHLAGKRRAMGVAIFFCAGLLGGVIGSATVPLWAKTFGIKTIAWSILPGVLACIALAWAAHSSPHRAAGARDLHLALPESERRQRWMAVGILYISNAMRFTVNMALVQLLVRWSEVEAIARAGLATKAEVLVMLPDQKKSLLSESVRQIASTINGPLQSGMQVGMGIAGLTLGTMVGERYHRRVMVWVPILGALAVAAVPFAPGSMVAFMLAIVCGAGFAGTMPMSISVAQRLLPHRTTLASGLMMGGAWSLAAVGPPLAQVLYERLGMTGAIAIVAATLALAGALVQTIPGRLFKA